VSLSRKLPTVLAVLVGLPGGRLTKWLVLAAWLAVVAVSVPLAGRLPDVEKDSTTVELPIGAEATRVTGLADRFPDGTLAPGIVVYARDGGLTAADRAKVDADRRAFAALAAGDVTAAASSDGAALALTVPLRREAAQSTLSDQARKLRTIAGDGLPAGLSAKLTGPAGNSLDASDARSRAAGVAMLITAIVVTALLLLTYRSPVLWLLPLVCVGLAFVVANAVSYLLARYANMTVDTGNAVVVTVLVFGVGTDYALLLLARYREELRRDANWHTAMTTALRRAVPAIAASAATVSLGLLCLLVADMGFNHTLGPAGAVGVLVGLATMITLLPALLVILGPWVFWPVIPRPGAAGQGRATGTALWDRVGRVVSARPRSVWVGCALALVLLGLGALGLRTGLDDKHLVVGTPESVAGQQLLAAHFPAGVSRPVQVLVAATNAPAVTAAVRGVSGVAQVRPPVASTDGTLVRIDAVLADPVDSPAAEATVGRVRAAVRAVPDAHPLVGGYTAGNMAKAEAQAHDRRTVIPLVLAVVLVVLVLLLRALVAPLLLIATVALSYLAAIGASWLLFRHAFGFPAVDVQVMLVGFLFLVALGVDYNIFLVSRMREEAARRGHHAAVTHALSATGGVITSAGVVLAATFATLALAPFVAFVEIGVTVAFGVLLDTALVRSVLVPALALDVGRRFWWPSRLALAGPRDSAEESVPEPRRAGLTWDVIPARRGSPPPARGFPRGSGTPTSGSSRGSASDDDRRSSRTRST
jgi:putative drug exporter of the RND superfamily